MLGSIPRRVVYQVQAHSKDEREFKKPPTQPNHTMEPEHTFSKQRSHISKIKVKGKKDFKVHKRRSLNYTGLEQGRPVEGKGTRPRSTTEERWTARRCI